MAKREYKIVRERIFWSYANLAMAHTAVERNQEKYNTFNYMIRAKLYKGLYDGTMNVRTLFDDEKIKLLSRQKCSYCGSLDNLALDHSFPQNFDGTDAGDNLIYACKSCNSSKGKKDLMEWMHFKNQFPPLMILRRYLKLIIEFCDKEKLMDVTIEELHNKNYPFKIELVPINFSNPNLLRMTI